MHLYIMTKTRDTRQDDELAWAQLMCLAQQGDKQAYENLLRILSRVISAYLHKRFGRYEFIDDCVQESLMAIHQARGTYNSKQAFKPWLFAIVRNKTIDVLRKHKRHQNKLEKVSTETQQKHYQTGIESDIESQQLLTALSPLHREALTLTKFIGMSNSEAADKLSISESAMKVRVHRAIAETKKLLQAESV